MRNALYNPSHLAIVVACAICLLHLSEPLKGQTYPTRIYSTLDGLPSNSIFDIEQDQSGVMWFATLKGLVAYDGQKWDLASGTGRIPHSENTHLKALKDGSLWIAGQDNKGLLIRYIIEDVWKTIELPDNLKDLYSLYFPFGFEVAINETGYSVWLSSDETLYVYTTSDKLWTSYQLPSRVNTIKLRNETPLFCTENGLYRFVDGMFSKLSFDRKFKNENVLTVAHIDSGMYLMGFDWLARTDGNQVKEYWEDVGMANVSIYRKYDLIIDERGRIFFNCDSPIQLFNKSTGKARVLETKGKIENAKSIALFRDFENNIWVGDHRGLFKFNQLRFRNFNKESGLVQDEVSSIIETNNGMILLANAEYLNFLQRGQVVKQAEIPVQKNQVCRVLDILTIDDGTIYLACGPAGLFRFQDGQFRKIIHAKNPDFTMTSIERWQNEIMVSSMNGGIFRLVNDRLVDPRGPKGIRKLVALDTALYAMSRRGLIRISASDTMRIESSLRDANNVFAIIEWENELLVGSMDGLYQIKGNRLDSVHYGGQDVPIFALMKDKADNLWLGTDNGVRKWDGTTLKKYDISNGLVGSEVNRNALIQDSHGAIWIGTEKGATMYDEMEDLTLNLTPKLTITSIRDIRATSYDPEVVNELPYNLNSVEIAFKGLSFVNEEKINYRYRLDGFDTDWRLLDNNINTSIRYTNLRWGNYSFKVQSRIEQGNWSDTADSSFAILRPFYLRWWFFLIVGFFLSGLLYVIYRIRFYYLLKRQELLKKEVLERTKEISLLNESLEQIVSERTKELEDRNERLAEYAFINAHMLRGPLTRIQSLAHVVELSDERVLDSELLAILKDTTKELDEVIFAINETLRDEQLRKQRSNRPSR